MVASVCGSSARDQIENEGDWMWIVWRTDASGALITQNANSPNAVGLHSEPGRRLPTQGCSEVLVNPRQLLC